MINPTSAVLMAFIEYVDRHHISTKDAVFNQKIINNFTEELNKYAMIEAATNQHDYLPNSSREVQQILSHTFTRHH